MLELINFRFEGKLADEHRMNFYEAARFQYAAARLLVKLAQFRRDGSFSSRVTTKSNFQIELVGQKDGSFNINVEDSDMTPPKDQFITLPLSNLVAYVGERVIEKSDDASLVEIAPQIPLRAVEAFGQPDKNGFEDLAERVSENPALAVGLPQRVNEAIRRRASEVVRGKQLQASRNEILKIDPARAGKIVAMAAPLFTEMATAFRSSAETLEVSAVKDGNRRVVVYLNQEMAEEIETAIVDKDITPILVDIVQFNKDNGWGNTNGMITRPVPRPG